MTQGSQTPRLLQIKANGDKCAWRDPPRWGVILEGFREEKAHSKQQSARRARQAGRRWSAPCPRPPGLPSHAGVTPAFRFPRDRQAVESSRGTGRVVQGGSPVGARRGCRCCCSIAHMGRITNAPAGVAPTGRTCPTHASQPVPHP